MNKKTILLATISAIVAIAILLVGCVSVTQSATSSDTVSVYARDEMQSQVYLASSDDEITVKYTDFASGGTAPGSDGIVDTAAEFVYMLKNPNRSYTLGCDFYTEELLWQRLPNYNSVSTLTINGGYKDAEGNDARHRITYAPNFSNETATLCNVMYGGLFSVFSGTMRDVDIVFRGRMECDVSQVSGQQVVYYGGIAGKMQSAQFTNCGLYMMGAISVYANRTGATLYVGGLAGQMDNVTFSECELSVGGSVDVSSLYEEEEGTVSSTRNNILYAGGLSAICINSCSISNCKVTVAGQVATADVASSSDKNYNGDAYVLPAGGLFAVGGSLNLIGCDVRVSARINATAMKYSSAEGPIAGGFFGIAGSYQANGGSTVNSLLYLTNNVITLSSTITAVSSREKDGNKANAGNTYNAGIVGKFNSELDTTSVFSNNAILYYAGIDKSAKCFGTSYYGYLSGNNSTAFSKWNKQNSNNWTVLEGSDTVSSITVRQSTNGSGNADNGCGDIGVLMVYGGGTIKAEIDETSGKLQFVANQKYSKFKNWYSDLNAPTPYTQSQHTGEVIVEDTDSHGNPMHLDINGNPYTKYIFRPSSGNKTVYAVFLTEVIDSAGSFVQWTEEMNSGLNKPWVVVDLAADLSLNEENAYADYEGIIVKKGVNIVNDFYGTFNGNNKTITFQNSVVMNGTANFDSDELVTYFGSAASGENTVGSGTGIFRVLHAGATVKDLKLVFAGKMYGGAYGTAVDDFVAMGVLAAINEGTIRNITLEIPQAGNLVGTAKSTAIGGGLVGVDNGTITEVVASLQGNYTIQGNKISVGGLIGECNTTGTKVYSRFNIDAKGQLEGYLSGAATNCNVGGFVGSCNGQLDLDTVIVNIHDVSNMGGDVLTASCIDNKSNYSDLQEEFANFHGSLDTSGENIGLNEIIEDVNELGVATSSTGTLAQLKAELQNAKSKTSNAARVQYVERYVLPLFLSLDCNALCAECARKSNTAYFVANVSGGKRVINTWAIGSYGQYPGDTEHAAGINYMSYIGSKKLSESSSKTLADWLDEGFNLIYVRNGTASAAMNKNDITFTVPLEDSAHVFTGWYVNYNHTTMVTSTAATTLSGNALVIKSNLAASVWYSRVINSMMTTGEELDVLAVTTNAGQDYANVEFSLGCDIDASDNFRAIGTATHPFRGTLDGKGYSVSIHGLSVEDDVDAVGLFGYLGSGGVVKQLTVKIISLDDLSGRVFGAVVGVNSGVVGQNSQNERVRCELYADASGASVAGGIVGINRLGGLVQNTEMHFMYSTDGYATNLRATSAASGEAAIAGGTVGANYGITRNCKVTCNVDASGNYEFSVYAGNNGPAYAGTLVGRNFGQLYSGVSEVFMDAEVMPGLSMTVVSRAVGNNNANSYGALLVGYNDGGDMDALWAVYQLDTTDGFQTPVDSPLINGTMADIGNRLVRYGYGTITTEIYANSDTQMKGGNILFASAPDAHGVPFYSYTQTLTHGEIVQEAAGSFYSPAIGNLDTTGLSGVTRYAVFADAEINDTNEFYKFVELVNTGFKAYVAYLVNLTSGTALQLNCTDSRFHSIGEGDSMFVGSFDGGNRDIEIRCTTADYASIPLFGTIGPTSEVCNFALSVEPMIRYRKGYTYLGNEVVGGMAYVNLGTIRNITFKFQSGVYGDVGYTEGYAKYAGAMVGYNAGHIVNCNISLNAGTIGGVNMAARVFAQYAGGVVGYNAESGWVGSDALSSVVLALNNDTMSASIVGVKGAGALVGLNEGNVANASAIVRGIVGAPQVTEDNRFVMGATVGSDKDDYYVAATNDLCSVGGLIGVNRGRVYGSRATVTTGAEIRGDGGYMGGLVGFNDNGQLGVADADSALRVVWQHAITNHYADTFGGLAGANTGTVRNAEVLIEANVAALTYVGGAVGRNSGYMDSLTVTVQKNVTLTTSSSQSYVGGLVAYHANGTADKCAVTINGVLGSATTAYTGGFAGYAKGIVRNSYAVLYKNLIARDASGFKGLAVGKTSEEMEDGEPRQYGENAWAVAFNSDRTLASVSAKSGFNVLKIVGSEMVSASLVRLANRTNVRFTSNQTSGLVWYTDISILEKNTGSNTVFTADATLHDCVYHLCAYDLEIDNFTDLANLYTFVNSADLFYGVMFKLINDIDVPYGSQIRPIGTAAYPFTGIFEGDGHTINFHSGSGIEGSALSGLFGYISSGAEVRNFIMQIDSDVLIGSTTDSVGALAGRIDGTVRNVAINLVSAPYSRKEGALVGALAGYIAASANFENVWVVNYNGAVKGAVGKDLSVGNYNLLDVYGRGIMRITRRDTDWYDDGIMQFDISAISGQDYFDHWYSEFKTSTVFTDALGVYRGTTQSVFYRPDRSLLAKRFTVSFIKMVISSEQDFYNFAANINTYGVADGQFRFDLSGNANKYELTIDLSQMAPIGTVAHPFQASLDGSVHYNNPDSYAYTLILKNAVQNADYSGLFGYIGEGATVRNLVVRADNTTAQSIGFRESIYTGFFAGYIQGSAAHPVLLDSVVVGLNTNTTLVNSHDDAIGGIAGLWGDHIDVRNTWVVLPENGAYNVLGSCRTYAGIRSYTETLGVTYSLTLPNTMYLCGDGKINYRHQILDIMDENFNCSIDFTLTSSEKYPLGFIEKSQIEVDQANMSDSMSTKVADGWSDKVFLALYIKTTVESEADLLYIADLINVQNRSYLGVTFTLMNDITLSAGNWTPIGGAVETYVGSGEYKQVSFIGAFDGGRHTITMPADMECTAQFAGLFGILSSSARIRNLSIVCAGKIGGASTQYAGVLAGVDQGADLRNIIVDVGQTARINANMSSSRVAVNQALVYDVYGNVTNYAAVAKATNVWVLNRNSRYSSEQNLAEQKFYDTVGTTWQGRYNGGINVVTVIANGTVNLGFYPNSGDITGVLLRNADATTKPIRMWYTAPGGVVTGYDPLFNGATYANEFIANSGEQGLVMYASFLNEFIDSIADLTALAIDVSEGCDLYGLTFYLTKDVTIDAAAVSSGFTAIGTDVTPFGATFDGQGYTLKLASDAVIEGRTAGVFGVLGEYGVIRNLKMVLEGTIGRADYTQEEVNAGKVNTRYAAAVAISYGALESVIIDATRLKVNALAYGIGVAAIADDKHNNNTNTWLVVNADNDLTMFGTVFNNTDSTINVMRVVGMGHVSVTFDVQGEVYYIEFSNDLDYVQTIDGVDYRFAVRGWYSNFSEDNQLSQALNVSAGGSRITAGDNGKYTAANDIFSSRFEVVVMSTVIVSEADLIAIAKDVNVGGYTFENTTFTLGHDIVISSTEFEPIGGAEGSVFKGTFQGMYNSNSYKIVMARESVSPLDGSITQEGVPLFGNNSGLVENLIVELTVNVMRNNTVVGIIARYNYGTIRNSMVRIYRYDVGMEQAVTVYGTIVGGIAGYNGGNVQNCVVYVAPRATIYASRSAGGLVGQNEGNILGSTAEQFAAWRDNSVAYDTMRPWYDSLDDETRAVITLSSVLLDGSVRVVNNQTTDDLFGGGAVGESRDRATVYRVTVRISTRGTIFAEGRDVEIGGLMGRSRATVANCVVMNRGTVSYADTNGQAYAGYCVGNLQGSAPNCWLVVPVPPFVDAVGNGSSVNVLQINGNGVIDTYLDESNNIIFRDITPTSGAALDGWYINSGIQVPDDVGGVDASSFRPNSNITGYVVNVVFINTQIYTVDNLLDMAKTVNAGLFSKGLTFTLMADLVIDVATTDMYGAVTIGTKGTDEDNAFKHVFEGNNFTITVRNSDNNRTFGAAYMGLFGYTGQDAIIRNLNLVLESGTYGERGNTQVIGALVGENNGTVENCHVYLSCRVQDGQTTVSQIPVRIIGAKVGGIVGENFGTIRCSSITSYASLAGETALSSRTNQYVGGVVGNNRSIVKDVEVNLHEPAGYRAMFTIDNNGSSYVGGVAGNNAFEIDGAYVQLNGITVEAHSAVLACTGGIAGSNTGMIKNSYVAWDRVTMSADHSAGGIVGANNHNLSGILIDYTVATVATVGVDGAVGSNGKDGVADNVWVYNHTETLNSTNAYVNNMTSGSAAVSHNDIGDVLTQGEIYFDATIDSDHGMTVFADADTDFKAVRLDAFVSYNGDKLHLTTYSDMRAVRVRGEIRNTIGDQTELKALARALLERGQTIKGTYTLVDDIVVTGAYTAVGAIGGNGFEAAFVGNMHSITFASDVTFTHQQSPFGVLKESATVDGLILRYEVDMSAEAAAGVANTNNGHLSDIIIYAEDGVTLRNPTYTNITGNANGQIWVVSREALSGTSVSANNRYGVIVVNGNGTLDVSREDRALFFRARAFNAITEFAGYSDSRKILFDVGNINDSTLFSVSIASEKYTTLNFTAEFLSTRIATSDDMGVLLHLLEMNYEAAATTYSLVNDITVDASQLQHIASFKGVLDGDFHTLTVLGDTDKAFGNFSAIMQNIVLDSTALTMNKYLFENNATATLRRVAVKRSGAYGYLMEPSMDKLVCEYVYVVATVTNCTHADNVGLLVQDEWGVTFRRNGNTGISVEAGIGDGIYFVGWYSLPENTTLSESDTQLNLVNGRSYAVRYLSSELASAEDMADLAQAVSVGYSFRDCSFDLTADITYAGVPIQGSRGFAGLLRGNGHTVTLGNNYLFAGFGGNVSDLIVRTAKADGFADGVGGELHNVVVISDANTATFAKGVQCRLDNVWMVASKGAANRMDSLHVLQVGDKVTVTVAIDTAVVFTASVSAEYFLLWRDAKGNVVFNDGYDVLTADADSADYYDVVATDGVSTADEYAYFAIATLHGYNYEVKLRQDITLATTRVQPMVDAFKLNGDGHTLTVSEPIVLAHLTERSGLNTHISNLVINVDANLPAFTLCTADDGVTDKCYLSNVVIMISGATTVDIDGEYANVWLLHKDDMLALADLAPAYTALPAQINVLRYEKGDLTVDYTDGLKVQAVTKAEQAFLGYYRSTGEGSAETSYALTGSGNRVQAVFVNTVLRSAAQWTHAANAMRWTGNNNLSFTLGARIEAGDDFVPFDQFAGTLDGAFYSVVVQSGTPLLHDTTLHTQGILGLAAGAVVRNLAIEIMADVAVDAEATWLQAPEGATVQNCWLINYTATAVQHPAGVRRMTVVNQGDNGVIGVERQSTTDGYAFLFVPNDTAVYRLRYYAIDEVGGADYEADDPTVFDTAETRDILAKFYYCYTVYVEVDGVPEELVRVSNLTADKAYWLGFDDPDPKVEFKSVVQGYVFAGFEYDTAAAAAIDAAHSTYTSLTIDIASLTRSITITAKFNLIVSGWSELTYGDKTMEEIDEYLAPGAAVQALFADAHYSLRRYVQADSDVKDDTDTPYHAGGYVIRFDIYYDSTLVGRSDGLSFRITPRELYFVSLRVGVKKYDGTSEAHIESAELGGFSAVDIAKGCKQQYSIAGIHLYYYDPATDSDTANAGTWYLRVADGSYIATTVFNSTILFNDDYVLPTGDLYLYAEQDGAFVKTDNRYSAIISKQELVLVVSDISIEYLDQFGTLDDSGNLVAFDIYDYLNFQVVGDIYGADHDVIANSSHRARLLRIAGDSTVVNAGDSSINYRYTIRYPGSYDIEVINDVLVNYEPKISENKATFTIRPSTATVRLNAMTMQYGDTLTSLNYTVKAASNKVSYLSDSDKDVVRDLYTNLDAADWFAMTLVPEYALVEGQTVPFGQAPMGTAGVQFRFVAANNSFALSDPSAVLVINDKNEKEYVMRAAGVLTITKRQIIYVVTSDATKAFGADDAAINGRTFGKSLMNGDKLRFSREAGELVGTYAITASVVDQNGKVVTSNYELHAYAEYAYRIEPRVVTVQRTGNGVFSYGSDKIQDMPFSTNLSDRAKSNILAALGVNQRFDQAIQIKVGYFGDTQFVGTYDTTTLQVTYGDRVNATLAQSCLVFELEPKSRTYDVVRAGLTVAAVEVNRKYDTTDDKTGVAIRVTGWAGNDGSRLGVHVEDYVIEGFSANAGTYYYEPTGLTLYARSGGDTLLDNYVINTVLGAKYVIERIEVGVTAKAGYYNEAGAFTELTDGVSFGDKRAQWCFALDGDLPEYMQDAYEEAELETDLAQSQWLVANLGIVARNIASLPAGTIVTEGTASNYYSPYSANNNISLIVDAYFSVEEIAIIVSEVRVTAESVKSQPTVSFVVKAYAGFLRHEDGSVEVYGSELEGYFDNTEWSDVLAGQRVVLNDNFAVSFNLSSYDVEKCTYTLNSYVQDGGNWFAYREGEAEPILYVSKGTDSGTKLVSSSDPITEAVNVTPGFFAALSAGIVEHPVATAGGVVAVAALAVCAMAAAVVYRRRRLFNKVQRNFRNRQILQDWRARQIDSTGDAPDGDASAH